MSILGAAVAWGFGAIEYIAHADATRLSFVILIAYVFGSIFVGRLTYTARTGDQEFCNHLPACWFISELMLGLGMIGTLVGFLILLQSAFGGQLDLSSAESAQRVLASMAVGFATAGLTTLVGLGASLLIKMQLINLEYLMAEEQ